MSSDNKTWVVYILQLSDASFYTGITNNLEARIEAHNKGNGSKLVRSKLPARLIYKEEGYTRSSALKREAAIKKLPRTQKQALVNRISTS